MGGWTGPAACTPYCRVRRGAWAACARKRGAPCDCRNNPPPSRARTRLHDAPLLQLARGDLAGGQVRHDALRAGELLGWGRGGG